MPEGYSRSRSRMTPDYSDNRGGYSQEPRGDGGGGGNTLLFVLAGAVLVVTLAVVGFVFRENIAQIFSPGEAQPTPTTADLNEKTPAPTFSATPEPIQSAGTEPTATPEPVTEPTATPPAPEHFTISAVGDITVDSSVLTDAKGSDGYDFAPMFSTLKDQLTKADLTIGTLESPVAGESAKYTGSPKYNTPESILSTLKDAGIDVLSTAHYHIFDQGFSGVEKTIENMNNAGILNTGTYLSKEDYHKPLIVPVKSTQIAILSFSESEKYQSSISGDKMNFGIKHLKLETVKKSIEEAKEAGAQVIIVMVSWGKEASKEPTDTMKTQAETIIKYGADMVIGTNPQYAQKVSRVKVTREDGTQAEGVVAYSLGCLLSGKPAEGKDSSMVLNVTFERDPAANTLTIKEATYVPTWVYVDSKAQYSILPAGKYKDSEDLLQDFSTKAKNRVKKVWEEIVALVGDEAATAAAE